jgi:hypothetical protein
MIHTARFVLSNAQIKTLPTIPVDLIPGLGVGRTIIPLSLFLALKSSAGYTNFDPGFAGRLQYAAPSASQFSLGGPLDLFLGSATDLSFQDSVAPPTFPNFTDPAAINARLQLAFNNGGSGNLTGGNASNLLTVTIVYYEAVA